MIMAEKAVFLDRDNTLIADPGYINHPDQVVLLEGVSEALLALKGLGFKLVLVTNQSAVARGIISEKDLKTIHDRMEHLLQEQGVSLDRIYYCPFHPDGVIEKYRKDSDWRKPAPGMLLRAAKDMDILLDRSWCIGDSLSDIEAGSSVGCKTILINGSHPENRPQPGQIQPDYKAVNLREAVNIIKQYLRTKDHVSSRSEPAQPVEPAPLSPEQVAPAEENSLPEDNTSPSPLITPQSTVPKDQSSEETLVLLKGILDQVKGLSRDRMFDEFSIIRLVAGITQMAVFLCLLIALWLLLTPDRRYEAIDTALGFAVVLQVMALTFYTMNKR